MARIIYERKSKMIPRPSCYCCKLPLDIERGKGYDNILYFDNHFYHYDCYMNMRKIKKRCAYCSEEINIEPHDDNVVFYKKQYYHKTCFIEWCNEKKTTVRKTALENINLHVKAAIENSNELFEKKKCDPRTIIALKKNASKRIDDWFAESDLCSFIRNEYGIQTIPWKDKIVPVIEGASYRTDVPIPVEDLLDMWERKIDVLRKANQKKLAETDADKKVTPEMIIGYDLSILVRKYNSYLNWKEKQRILASEREHSRVDNLVSRTICIGKQPIEKEKSNDISDLLDDIFG